MAQKADLENTENRNRQNKALNKYVLSTAVVDWRFHADFGDFIYLFFGTS